MYKKKGIIKHIFDKRVLTENFHIQEFAITIQKETPYPQDVQFQMTNDNCFQLVNIEVGDEVIVNFVLRGKYGKVNDKGIKQVYNTLECYNIKKI